MALDNLYEDKNFKKDLKVIDESQKEARKIRNKLRWHPIGIYGEDYHKQLEILIDNYIESCMTILSPSGSYNEISSKINELIDDSNEAVENLNSMNILGEE